jgi:hypothetical protein
MNLQQSATIRAIFGARELIFGNEPHEWNCPLGLAVLAQNRGSEIVFGRVTQPWLAKPLFRALLPAEFAAFNEPGYAKIAWIARR